MKRTLLNKCLGACFLSLFFALAVFAEPSSTISDYSQKGLFFKPSRIEQGFSKELQEYAAKHDHKIQDDPYLSIAAIIYVKEASLKNFVLTPALLDYALFEAGCPEANVFPYLLKFSKKEQFSGFLPEIFAAFQEQKADVCGLGYLFSDKENVHVLVILGARKKLTLEPFPKNLSQPRTVAVQGSLLGNYTDIKLTVTAPHNKILTFAPQVSGDAFLVGVDFGQGSGEYRLEVTGTGALGPEVLALFPVYVGIKPPERPHQELWQDPKIYRSPFEAEKALLALVNAEREKGGLPALNLSPAVSDIARDHSQEMIDQRYFAHVSPYSKKDLAGRLKAHANISAALTGENIALNGSIIGAHYGLMGSPAHRQNILNPGFTNIGIGIALQSDRKGNILYYVTEDFFSQMKNVDQGSFQEQVLKKMNKKRQELRLPPFVRNDDLSAVAARHAQDMAAADTLSFVLDGEHLSQKVQQAGLKFKYLSMNIFAFNDINYGKYLNSPELEQKQFKEIGIGLIQKDSTKFGPKTVWMTLIFSE